MNAVNLLVEIIREHTPRDIWRDSPLIGYRMLGNTNRGEIGEEFLRRYLAQNEIEVGNGPRTSRTDIRIGDLRFEIKTASLGANGTLVRWSVTSTRSGCSPRSYSDGATYEYTACCPRDGDTFVTELT